MPMLYFGTSTYYHPVLTAQQALPYIVSYNQLGKPENLAKANQLAYHLCHCEKKTPSFLPVIHQQNKKQVEYNFSLFSDVCPY